MKLDKTLATGLLQAHPVDAARVLESLPERDAVAVLGATPVAQSAKVVSRMAPHRAAVMLAKLEPSRAAAIVEKLGLDLAASILRRMEETRGPLMGALSGGLARSLESLMRFPEGTAASLMNPRVLALPGDLTVQQAHAHIREHPHDVRYNLYVVDREHRLVGVLNLRELLLARPKQVLSAVAHSDVLSLPARAGREAVVTHPAWRDARAVPVVDEQGVYLGAIRYPTLRRLEEEDRGGELEGSSATAESLGDLFSTGIASVVVALAGATTQPSPGSVKRGS